AEQEKSPLTKALEIISSDQSDDQKTGALASLLLCESGGCSFEHIRRVTLIAVAAGPDFLAAFVKNFEYTFLNFMTLATVKDMEFKIHAVLVGLLEGEIRLDPKRKNPSMHVSPTIILPLPYMKALPLDRMSPDVASRFSSAVAEYLKEGHLCESLTTHAKEQKLRCVEYRAFFGTVAELLPAASGRQNRLLWQVVEEFVHKIKPVLTEPAMITHYTAGIAHAFSLPLEPADPESERMKQKIMKAVRGDLFS
ncbi:MAG: hypothetical protein WC250_01955, partial [Candidatus Paceibacterota bacterium]